MGYYLESSCRSWQNLSIAVLACRQWKNLARYGHPRRGYFPSAMSSQLPLVTDAGTVAFLEQSRAFVQWPASGGSVWLASGESALDKNTRKGIEGDLNE